MNSAFKIVMWIAVLAVIAWVGYAVLGNKEARTPTERPPITSTAPVLAEPIKIGVIAPLTGEGAVYGEPMQNVINLAVQEINAAGGINGASLELIYEDDKCTGEGGANATQKLVNVDKVKVIIGSACSSATLAAIPIIEGAQVSLFSPAASSPDLTNKSRFFSRDYPNDSSQGQVLAEAAFNLKKWGKVVFIQEQKDYPLGIYKAFEARFKKLGGTVTKEEFAPGAVDFRSILTKTKAVKPDAVFIDVQASPAANRILKQLADLKWKVPLIVNDVVAGDLALIKEYAILLEGALTAEFGISKNAKFQALIANYKAQYGIDMPYQSYGQTEYDAVYLVKEAVRVVGYDGEKIADWFRTVRDWEGASGLVTIGADGDRVGGHRLEVIKNGKVEIAQ